MPVISMFYGIIILMYFKDNRQHHSPHHVKYQGDEVDLCPDTLYLDSEPVVYQP